MSKIKPERVAGIVALSYLVLIPAGAMLVWQKLRYIDDDLTTVWENEFPGAEARGSRPVFDTREQFRRLFSR